MADFTGDSFDNVFTGTADPETITSGGGIDTLDGGAGNDIIVLDGPATDGSSFNGGSDADTLVLTPQAFNFVDTANGTGSYVRLTGSILTSLETVQFDSVAGQPLRALLTIGQIGSIGTLRGGAGTDGFIVIAPNAGTFTVPTLNLVDWTGGDFVSFLATNASGSVTFNTANHTGIYNIGGGVGNDTINGSDGIEFLSGGDGNDTINAAGGNDRLNGGAGLNTLSGGAGNDTLVIDTGFAGGSKFDGGTDTDTLELHNPAVQLSPASNQFPTGIPTTTFNTLGSAISSIERVDFQSTAGNQLTLLMGFGGPAPFASQVNAAGLSDTAILVGGAGYDNLTLVAGHTTASIPGGFKLDAPVFTYQGWTGASRAYLPGDRVVVLNNGNANGTINGSVHDGIQVLAGGSGTVAVTGTDGMEYLAATGAGSVLLGMGGDDTLALQNLRSVTLAGGIAAETTFTGQDVTYDGGAGTDFLLLGGNVNFKGTVSNIEGLYLAPAYNNVASTGLTNTNIQNYTNVTVSGATWAQLPGNLVIDGVGSVTVNMTAGTAFNGSGYTFDAGSKVQFTVEGSTANDTIIGTANGDTINGDVGDDTLTGGGGADVFQPSYGNDMVTDFTPGTDKIDLRDVGISSFTQAQTYLSQPGSDATFSILYNGVINSLALKGVGKASLTANDFLFASATAPRTVSGTENADTLIGGSGNDTLNGLGGGDTIVTGGGKDTISGGAGNDTVVFDFNPAQGSVLDGGGDTDTLELHNIVGAPVNQGALAPGGSAVSNFTFQNASYLNPVGGSLSSFERVDFKSAAGTTLSAQFFFGGDLLNEGNVIPVPNQIGGGLSANAELVGGSGNDGLVLIALTRPGVTYPTFTAPSFNYTTWSTPERAYQAGDRVYVIVTGDGNVTLNGSAHSGVQFLSTGGGDDTITGTDGMEYLSAGGGKNTIDARGGDDTLALHNVIPNDDAGVAGSEGTETGANTTFNGGTGTDFLSIGGNVNFQGKLESIEGLHLQAKYDNTVPFNVSQNATVMTVSGATWAQLPSDLLVDGTGTVIVNMASDDTFDGSGYTFDAGSSVNFTVNGSTAGDAIVGTSRDDTLNGGDGNDRLNGGGGKDAISGGNDDDTIVIDTAFAAGSTFDGGNGEDTLELHQLPIQSITSNGPTTIHEFGPTTVSSIERIDFQSQSENGLAAIMSYGAQTASLAELIGGDGHDVLVIVGAGQSGDIFTIPTLTTTSWTDPAKAYLGFVAPTSGDGVVLLTFGKGDYTLNAAANHTGIQALTASDGNDVLNGTDGMERLDGGAGVNKLYAKGGDDALAIVNLVGAPVVTGKDSLFDGGGGIDFLTVGGPVDFQGELVSIDGIHLQPAAKDGTQAAAALTIGGKNMAVSATNLILDGQGTITVNLASGDNFNGSAYTFEAGSKVTFTVNGSIASDTIVGTVKADTLHGDDGDDTLTGGDGADIFQPSLGQDTVTDFTPGTDKIDLREVGISSFTQLQAYMADDGGAATFSLLYNGATNSLALAGVAKASLTANAFLFASATAPRTEDGTENADTLFGGSGADTLSGLGGKDIILPGTGKDTVSGGDGDDTIVFDAHLGLDFNQLGSYDGGTGIDTIELRDTASVATTRTGLPLIGYTLFKPGMVQGVERANFVSRADTEINLLMVLREVNAGIVTTHEVISQANGGAGNDTINFQALRGMAAGETTIFMPDVAVTNWTSNTKSYLSYQSGDEVRLAAGPIGSYTFTASEANAAAGIVQKMTGNAGNDTLLGSSGADVLDGAGGTNVLKGGGGNDALVIANNNANAFTGAGSTFDGEGGTDFLSIGGVVDFQGTLAGIEGLYLQPAFVTAAFGTQPTAQLTISGAQMTAMASNLVIDGVGSVTVNLSSGDSFNGAGYTFEAGSNVTFTVNGSTAGDTLAGTARNDKIDGGAGSDIVVHSGNFADYQIVYNPDGSIQLSNASGGTDTIANVETFRFADGDKQVSTSDGILIDGYLAGSTVYIDANKNGILDPGEPTTTSDAKGNFTLNSLVTGPIRAFGGTNIDTGLANTLEFSAPSGSTVVTPLTTLIQELIEDGKSAAEAEEAVEQAFGLDATLDLTQLDPIEAAGAGGAAGLAALEVQKAAAAVAEVLDAVDDEGGSADDALNALAGLVGDGGAVDLTSSTVLTEIIIAGGIAPEDIQQLVEETQAVTEAIDDATDLGDITDVQGNAVPVAVAESFDVIEDSVSPGNVLTNATDDDGDVLSVSTVNGQAITIDTKVQGDFGELTIDADGNFSFSADADVLDAYAPGTHLTEIFDYVIGDGNGGIASSTLTFDVTTIDDLLSLATGNGNTVKNYTGADETIKAGRGNDTLHGMGGSDRIYGNQGSDTLFGDDGWDLLAGGQGNDTLQGGNGDDVLAGGKGADTMFGGAGADVFEFGAQGADRDVIGDFLAGTDRVHLSDGITVTGMSESGGATTLSLSSGGSIVLNGVTGIADYDTLLTADLPLWSAGLPLV